MSATIRRDSAGMFANPGIIFGDAAPSFGGRAGCQDEADVSEICTEGVFGDTDWLRDDPDVARDVLEIARDESAKLRE